MFSVKAPSKTLGPPFKVLRAGFATCKPRLQASPPGPRGSVRRPPPPIPLSKRLPRQSQTSSRKSENPPETTNHSPQDAISNALRDSNSNNLLSPVTIPDDPAGVLRSDHPATSILSHSAVVITRQLELMNVMLGFEQANKYVIMDPQGNHIGYMAERDLGMGNMMARQIFSTHRSFTTHVFDRHGKEVLRFHRPFAWISSRIGIYDPLEIGTTSSASSTTLGTSEPGSLITEANPASAQVSSLELSEMRIIGEAQQQWAPLRRKYNLFLYRKAPSPEDRPESQKSPPPSQPLSNSQAMDLTPYKEDGDFNQFAYVNEPFLSWNFSLLSSDSKLIGSVNRNFVGFGREFFTDTGVYALRMDAAGLLQEGKHVISQSNQQTQTADTSPSPGMTLDQRAVMLATAVSVDFDYFSRKSGSGGGMGFWPMWFPGWGGGAAAGEAGAEASAVEGVSGVGGATQEGAVVGTAGTAGYEAMQGARGSSYPGTAPPDQVDQDGSQLGQNKQQPDSADPDSDFWGNNNDPWGGNSGGHNGDDGGGGGDGGDFDWF